MTLAIGSREILTEMFLGMDPRYAQKKATEMAQQGQDMDLLIAALQQADAYKAPLISFVVTYLPGCSWTCCVRELTEGEFTASVFRAGGYVLATKTFDVRRGQGTKKALRMAEKWAWVTARNAMSFDWVNCCGE